MRRTALGLEAVADRRNLENAFWRAALGKRGRIEVRRFEESFENEIERLRSGILEGSVKVGCTREFRIFDPKPRLIHAPVFRERVLHHALMAWIGPVIDRFLVWDTYACRLNKGTRAAVARAQLHGRRYPWFLKFDVQAYFESIDHEVMKSLLRQRIKGVGVLRLCDRILDAHHSRPGKGLPIGSLTSQYFANLYLAHLDRLLLADQNVSGFVRYMDDSVIWGTSKTELREAFEYAQEFCARELKLKIKDNWQLQKSSRGLTLCGFRIYPHTLRLSKRRKRRYRCSRLAWERAYRFGWIDSAGLQRGYAAALAITAGADVIGWRRTDLALNPTVEA